MAVQKSKKSRSRRDMRRSHDHLSPAQVATERNTGETHRRHYISKSGYYKGKKVLADQYE